MEDMTPCSLKNPEVFQRVWDRVMAGRNSADSPIESIPTNLQGDLSCGCLDALAQAAQACGGQNAAGGETPDAPQPPAEPEQNGAVPEQSIPDQPAPEPQPPAEEPQEPETLPAADGPSRGNDLPQQWEEPQETSDRTARLRGQVKEALEGWQFYRYLARRARGNDARVLNSLAGELHRSARKLSAAYFLLTGLRYWPSELLSAPVIPSYWGALRTRHQCEQRQEVAFRMAADDWDDADLLALHKELAEGCQARCRQLRTLLEQDIT